MTREVDKSGYVRLSASVLAEINESRVEQGLKPIVIKLRSCLSCDKQFKSEGSRERICGKCKSKNLDAGTFTPTSISREKSK